MSSSVSSDSAPTILALAGSTRANSYNGKLLRIAAEAAADAGARVTRINLRDFPMALYDGDLETEGGLPANAIRLKQLLIEHGGLLIASPEYNGSISAVLKNAIDWASRRERNEPALVAFSGKIAGIMSASPGSRGGLRGLAGLRSILEAVGMLVLPNQAAVPRAHEAFDENGKLRNPDQQRTIEGICRQLTDTL